MRVRDACIALSIVTARLSMVGLTLEKVLQLDSFRGSRILTGEGRLERVVTNVTVGEVPDIADWLTGGELVLSTFFAASRDADATCTFAKKIIMSPAAGLAVKPARFLESMPPTLLEHAREIEFPIIEVPSDRRWTTMMADVYAAIAQLDLADAGEAGDDLLRSAIDGRGRRSIAQGISSKIAAPVVILDLITGASVEAKKSASIPQDLVERLKPEHRPQHTDRIGTGRRVVERFGSSGLYVYAVDVVIGGEVVAVVGAFAQKELDRGSVGLLRKAAEAVAVDMARERAIEEAHSRLHGDFLEDLLQERIPPHEIDSRVARLGGDVTGGFIVLWCSYEPREKFGRFFREASRIIRNHSKSSLVIEHAKSLAIILAPVRGLARNEWGKFGKQAAASVMVMAETLGGRAGVGLSRWRTDSGQVVRSIDEAKIALEAGQRMGVVGCVTEFDQIGVYRLLLPLAREASEDGRHFYEETIGRLAEYDERFGTGLVRTLEVFRKNNDNIALTAQEVFTHRHTVRYRLQRIAAITGCDPLKAADREKLYMGLYLKDILGLR